MEKYTPATYGDRIAEVYDDLYQQAFDIEPAVGLLAELAGAGRALELGIGTGRVALPLAARGVVVLGVNASESMVKQMRKKVGGKGIPVTIGDFTKVPVRGTFDLVYVVFNTIFGLDTQDAQVACFANVARRLRPGGVFLIEAFVPDLTRFVRGQNISTARTGVDEVWLDASRYDAVNQVVNTQHIHITGLGTRLFPVRLRYSYPPELDLMARLAGMRLKDRWGGWRKEPFTAASTSHVSVYGKE